MHDFDDDFEEQASGDLKCWSCNQYMTFEERSENDGDCIHCGAEILLDEL